MVIIIMGVTESGKSTIGEMLAGCLGLPFFDGDHYHPQSNIDKMSSGIPLDRSVLFISNPKKNCLSNG
jgi:carbohydrate kinase (thermoresistant glucokinase family)